MKPKPWDRKLWGVALMPSNTRDSPLLLGSLWDKDTWQHETYPGQPLRTLTFQKRKQCRAWIAAHRGDYFGKDYRCVRVRELVEVCDE